FELTPALLGSPKYMSPEHICGERTDARTDVYSFGVVCYYLASGAHPFDGETSREIVRRHLDSPVPLLGEVGYRRPCPAGFERLSLDCLAKVPEERPQSMQAIVSPLKRLYRQLLEKEDVDLISQDLLLGPSSPAARPRRSFTPSALWQRIGPIHPLMSA